MNKLLDVVFIYFNHMHVFNTSFSLFMTVEMFIYLDVFVCGVCVSIISLPTLNENNFFSFDTSLVEFIFVLCT